MRILILKIIVKPTAKKLYLKLSLVGSFSKLCVTPPWVQDPGSL